MIILLDTETTGLDKPRIVDVSVGLIWDLDTINDVAITGQICKPPVPIDIKAMSVHNITNEMVDGCFPFEDTGIYQTIVEHNKPDNIFVAHNAKFDLEVLKNEGIDCVARVIDTYKCCKKFFMDLPDVELNLQYLKYYLKLYLEDVPETIEEYAGAAHGAAADVVTLFLLFRRMVAKHGVDELIKISETPLLYTNMPFGKHKGRNIQYLVLSDKGYTNWVFKNIADEDVQYSFKYWTKVANDPKNA